MRKTKSAAVILMSAFCIASAFTFSANADVVEGENASIKKVTVVSTGGEEGAKKDGAEETSVEENPDSYVIEVKAETVNINKSSDSEEVLTEAKKGEEYKFVEDLGNGWAEISVNGTEAYIPLNENASIVKKDSEEEAKAAVTETEAKKKRESVVKYALSMVGGRYIYGGTSPAGFDCSGFTQYVLRNSVGVFVPRSSASQATIGTTVDASGMQPGDLVFYGRGRGVNHVGIYIGNGNVVHASNAATGIKVSPWNYRAPVRIANVIG